MFPFTSTVKVPLLSSYEIIFFSVKVSPVTVGVSVLIFFAASDAVISPFVRENAETKSSSLNSTVSSVGLGVGVGTFGLLPPFSGFCSVVPGVEAEPFDGLSPLSGFCVQDADKSSAAKIVENTRIFYFFIYPPDGSKIANAINHRIFKHPLIRSKI